MGRPHGRRGSITDHRLRSVAPLAVSARRQSDLPSTNCAIRASTRPVRLGLALRLGVAAHLLCTVPFDWALGIIAGSLCTNPALSAAATAAPGGIPDAP